MAHYQVFAATFQNRWEHISDTNHNQHDTSLLEYQKL